MITNKDTHNLIASGVKYLYNSETKLFDGAPRSINNLLGNPDVDAAIKKSLRYLGED